MMALRREAARRAEGDILVTAAGTGLELGYLDWSKVHSVTAVDASREALETARSMGRAREAELLEADSRELPFTGGSFDTVLDCFSLCVQERPEESLKEARRVMREGGKGVFLEHTRSANPLMGLYQDTSEPLVRLTGRGCSWNQRVERLATSSAGLRLLSAEPHLLGTVSLLEFSPSPQ